MKTACFIVCFLHMKIIRRKFQKIEQKNFDMGHLTRADLQERIKIMVRHFQEKK